MQFFASNIRGMIFSGKLIASKLDISLTDKNVEKFNGLELIVFISY